MHSNVDVPEKHLNSTDNKMLVVVSCRNSAKCKVIFNSVSNMNVQKS